MENTLAYDQRVFSWGVGVTGTKGPVSSLAALAAQWWKPAAYYGTASSTVETVSLQTSEPAWSLFKCHDANGWILMLPDGSLSTCFVDGVVLLIPSILLAVFGSLETIKLRRSDVRITSTYPWYVWAKFVLVLAKWLVLLATSAFAVLHYNGFDIRTSTPLVMAGVLTLGMYIHVLESRKSHIPADSLLFYWLLSAGTSGLKVVNSYLDGGFSSDFTYSTLFSIVFALDCFVFALEYILPKVLTPKKSYAAMVDDNDGLLEKADVFSKVSLSWMNPLIVQAAEAALTTETLPDIDKEYNTKHNFGLFEKYWARRKSDSTWALVWALLQSFGSMLSISACYEVSFNCIGFADPFLLRYLILFASSYYNDTEPAPIAVGFYIAGGMFVVAMCRTAFATNLLQYLIRCVTCVRSALQNAIYEKSLRLSSKERAGRSTGEIVNLMAVDVQTICNAIFSITILWDAPSQFIMCMISLHAILGASFLCCFLVLAIFLPLNMLMTNLLKAARKKQMSYVDQRTRLTTEIITNVKSLKLYGWEKALLARLDDVRNNKQLKSLTHIIWLSSSFDFFWSNVPFWTAGCCFAAFVYLNPDTPLTSDIVFPCISLFDMMTGPISGIPFMVSGFIDASVSLVRVRGFLIGEERQADAIVRLPPATTTGERTVEVRGATGLFEKGNAESVALQNLDFSAAKGELSCVVGRVGSGKSSFLQMLLGDLYLSEGTISIKGSVAYASQQPWLMNGTVKENILFGNKFDQEFYQATIEACSLVTDLEILPDGDATEIGERGVSLSGGQKARVSLARAVYARADVYLLDDPLSAVDEHVGRHITKHVLGANGLLASKTRILVTNAIGVLSRANRITLLEEKTVAEYGNYAQVMARKQHLYTLIKDFGRKDDDSEGSSSDDDLGDSDTLATSTVASAQISRRGSASTLRRASVESLQTKAVPVAVALEAAAKKKTERTQEGVQKGHVQMHVYKRYLIACGTFGIVLSLILIVVTPLFELSSNFWLKAWVEANSKNNSNDNALYWIGGYFVIGLVRSLGMVARRIVTRSTCGLRASRILHDTMAVQVLRAPMSFFETTPIGRVVNRFSSDVNELDDGLPNAFIELLRVSVSLLVSLSVVIFSAPAILLILAPLSFLYNYYQKYYQAASRELKRILSMSRSPIYAHFQESLHGAHTIRAYGQLSRFQYQIRKYIDVNIRTIFLFRSVNRWLSFRLQAIGSVIVVTTAMLVVVGAANKSFSPGLIGIMMTYTLEVTDYLNNIVRAIVNLETSVVGVERVLEYCDLKSEAPEMIEENRPPAVWPQQGQISFKNYATRYRENLDLVLKDIDVEIKPHEKIGVVGRTGAGKSSMVMSLFRMIEPAAGTIEIDGVDVSKIGLADLRPRLSIIPQDSQLFEGTIRDNLDPFNDYSDDEVWRVLELSHLKSHVESMPDGLNSKLAEGGSNMSAGQRQLMCLGRALISTSSILVLDEATASVDVQTDKVVQETIRSEFKDRTIVTIAHRINTILDSDRIMVLDKGRVAEFDSPQVLLQNKDSLFYALCKQGGFVEEEGAEASEPKA